MPTSKQIILGIDPGYADMGWGVISIENRTLNYILCDTIKTTKNRPMPERLRELDLTIQKLFKKYKPDLLSVEKIFFAANQKTAIEVAQARGIVLLAAAHHGVPVVEYTPLQVKQALTSSGNADKSQVAHMVKVMLKLKEMPTQDDAIDAIAIALCAAFDNSVIARIRPGRRATPARLRGLAGSNLH